jgi:hypothetical protein
MDNNIMSSRSQTSAPSPHLWTDQRLLLTLAIVAFNGASLYTTKLGFDMVFTEGDIFATRWLPWILAFSIALMLTYFTIEIASRSLLQPLAGVVSAYLLFAGISMFFNFNTFYSALAARDSEHQQSAVLIHTAQVLFDEAEAGFRKLHNIDGITRRVDQARTDRDFERSRNDRPGRGQRYIALNKTFEDASSELRVTNERFERDIAPVRALRRRLPEVKSADYSALHAANQTTINVISELAAYAQSRGMPPSVDIDRLQQTLVDRRGVASNLSSIIEQSQLVLSGSASAIAVARFGVALFLSVLIDLSLLIGLLLSRTSDVRKARRRDASERIWADTKETFAKS